MCFHIRQKRAPELYVGALSLKVFHTSCVWKDPLCNCTRRAVSAFAPFCYLFGIGALLDREQTHRPRAQPSTGMQIHIFWTLRRTTRLRLQALTQSPLCIPKSAHQGAIDQPDRNFQDSSAQTKQRKQMPRTESLREEHPSRLAMRIVVV